MAVIFLQMLAMLYFQYRKTKILLVFLQFQVKTCKLEKELLLQRLFKAIVYCAQQIFKCNPQASEKGSSELTTGIIIGASPLCLVIFSPFVGYYVRMLHTYFSLKL